MTWIYVLSGLVAAGPVRLSPVRAVPAGEILMTANALLQLAFYVVVLIALAKPLGAYMANVYEGRSAANRIGGPIENFFYRLCGVDPAREMRWVEYAVAMLAFNLLGLLAVYALQRFQAYLPLNPQNLGAVSPDSSFNTAISFATNTNWQGYGGETTMSYLTQMLALTVQNFVSAASGMATLVALIRGFTRRTAQTIGNFWVDMTRSTLYILLPLSIVLALALVSQGVVQTLSAYHTVPLVESVEYDNPKLDAAGQPIKDEKGNPVTEKAIAKEQVIAVGPAASQVAIKQLGTNGGGFFNVNSAHPFENPTPLSNFLELLAILLIPAALCYTFGRMVGDTRQGWAILAAMTIVFVVLLAVCYGSEQSGNPAAGEARRGPDRLRHAGRRQHGRQGNALRHRQFRAVGDRHDRRLERLGQLDARFVYPARRTGADVADAARRSDLRRRRLGALRHDRVRAGRGVRRRAHDRPHAGVSRQEDRGLRDEDGRDRHTRSAVHRPGGHRDRRAGGTGQGRHRQSRHTRVLGNPLRVLLRRQQQRQRLRRSVREHAVLQHDARHCDVLFALLARRTRARDRGGARGQEDGARSGRERCPRIPRCS